jgi:protein-tyrosine phosphatase
VSGIRIESRRFDDPLARTLRDELTDEMVARYDGDIEPGAKPSAADVAAFLVALAPDGEPLGCGALRLLGGGAAEIKRMYVRPAARGRGVGRVLLAALHAAAREHGCGVTRVETGDSQPDATALYERAGYRRIPCFGACADSPRSHCYERRQSRHLDWDGARNVRDLGGLPVAGGALTRWGAIVRADALDHLTAAGWSALHAHGVRTVIDLRNDGAGAPDSARRPAGLTSLQLPLDGVEDTEFWERWGTGPQFGTPLYYGPFLERFPQRVAGVLAAIAGAAPGGVAVHCGIGRDRTGLIAALLLALAGVAPDAIAADYALSTERLGRDEQAMRIEAFLARESTTAGEVLIATLATLDVTAYLRAAGLGDDVLSALRSRLVTGCP